jgi:chemotaxis protein histidine kinase CheA
MKLQRTFIGLLLIFLCSCVIPLSAIAEENDKNRSLLQKGLTLHEIDQELNRVAQQEAKLKQQLVDTELQIRDTEKASVESRQHAAKVIRAYYMGDRDALWVLLFSIRSLSDALSTLEYLQMILQSDRDAIRKHTYAQQTLQQLKTALQASEADLAATKAHYLKERTKQEELQKELNQELAGNTEAEKLLKEIMDLNKRWQDTGVPLFRTYFKALAEAMKQLPELVGNGTSPSKHLDFQGLTSTFHLTDTDLNDFLRHKNPLFKQMTFQFVTDQLIASGNQEDVTIKIKGSYQLAEKSDGSQYVRFQIDELQFNGFTLPETTAAELEKDFDLGIYPQKLLSILQVTGVKLENGKLSLYLKLAV